MAEKVPSVRKTDARVHMARRDAVRNAANEAGLGLALRLALRLAVVGLPPFDEEGGSEAAW